MNQVLLKIEFNNNIYQLRSESEKIIEKIKNLKNDSDFLIIKVTEILLKTLNMISIDNNLSIDSNYCSNLFVGRWQNFQNLSRSLSKLFLQISDKMNLEEQDRILQEKVLENLNEKVEGLANKVWMQGRLPIHYNDKMEQLKKEIREEICLKVINPSTLLSIDTDTFHMLATNFNNFDKIKISELSGMGVCRSFINLINLLQKTPDNDENLQNKERLIEKFQEALTIALKLFIADCSSDIDASDYFHKLKSVEPVLALLENTRHLTWQEIKTIQFLHLKEGLEPILQKIIDNFTSYLDVKNYQLPREIVLHDLIWDMIEAIEQLTENDYLLIPVGTEVHLVMAELEVSLKQGVKFYSWITYNAGDGCTDYHTTRKMNNRLFVNPLKIEGIREQGLCYSFWKELFLCTIKEKKIDFFYAILNTYLIDIGKGLITNSMEKTVYRVQNFGICTFSASEMTLFSHLTKTEIVNFEKTKVLFTIKRQSAVVKKRLKCLTSYFSRRKRLKTGLANRRLKQSQRLLRYSYRYLNQLR